MSVIGERGPWQDLPFNNGQNYYQENIVTSCLRKGTIRVQAIEAGGKKLLGLRISGLRRSARTEAQLSPAEARILGEQLIQAAKESSGWR